MGMCPTRVRRGSVVPDVSSAVPSNVASAVPSNVASAVPPNVASAMPMSTPCRRVRSVGAVHYGVSPSVRTVWRGRVRRVGRVHHGFRVPRARAVSRCHPLHDLLLVVQVSSMMEGGVVLVLSPGGGWPW